MKITSDSYGSYNVDKICNLILFPLFKNELTEDERFEAINEWLEWTDKYHPKHYFGSYSLKSTRLDLPEYSDEGLSRQLFPYELYLPLRESNQNWYKENKDSQYAQYIRKTKRSKHLPISVTNKQLEKWLIATKKLNLIVD